MFCPAVCSIQYEREFLTLVVLKKGAHPKTFNRGNSHSYLQQAEKQKGEEGNRRRENEKMKRRKREGNGRNRSMKDNMQRLIRMSWHAFHNRKEARHRKSDHH